MTFARLQGLMSGRAGPERFVRSGSPVPAHDHDPATMPLEMRDARAFQAGVGGAAASFEEHGFALLGHRSEVRDWWPGEDGQSDLARIYHPEIDALLRATLFAGRRVEIDQNLESVYRGRPQDSIYAMAVHQDYGPTARDFALYLEAVLSPDAARDWQARYDREDVIGCTVISCWRTIGMREPLRHLPIALCDARTVATADVVMGAAVGGGANHIVGLRYNPAQRWYYYPEMTSDELLAIKVFECRKDDPEPRLRSIFHAAFEHPAMPADAERRYSFEHRAIVMLFRD